MAHTPQLLVPPGMRPDVDHAWHTDDDRFELYVCDEATLLLVPEHGLIQGARVFTLVHTDANGPYDTTTWMVVAPDLSATSVPPGSVLVVEEAEETERFEGYETWKHTACWFAPRGLVSSPTVLVGLDRRGIEDKLFSRGARRIHVASERLGSSALRSVPTASVDARVRDRGAAIAKFVAERIGLEVAEPTPTAGYSYVEMQGHNLNETIGNSWFWQLAYRVRRDDATGVLTLGLSATNVDADEVSGADSLHERASVWLALPASDVDASAAVPGVRLRDVVLSAASGEVHLVNSE